MRPLPTRLSAAFAGGAAGAVVNSLAVQVLGLVRPGSAPAPTPEWIYQRLVWGGLWGLLLMLPILRGKPVARGLAVSLAPSLARLTVFAPAGAGASGPLAVVLVFLFNAVWGAVAGLWYRRALSRARTGEA